MNTKPVGERAAARPGHRRGVVGSKADAETGSLIDCRELVFESSVSHPGSEHTKELWEMYVHVLETDSGHPEIGMDLKNQLLTAGFTNIPASMSFAAFSKPEEISAFHDLVTRGLGTVARIVDFRMLRLFRVASHYLRTGSCSTGVAGIVYANMFLWHLPRERRISPAPPKWATGGSPIRIAFVPSLMMILLRETPLCRPMLYSLVA